eukprot:symbB.v1.2.022650.t1/scaffold2004.1/size154144/5
MPRRVTSSCETSNGVRVGQVVRRSCKASAKAKEAKLFALMKCLPSETRQAMLEERFSQAQRLALERWIIAHKASQNHTTPCASRPTQLSRCLKGSTFKSTTCRPAGRSGVAGLHLHRRKVGKTFYRASVAAGPFRLSTGFTTKEEKAKEFLEVLLRIRARITSGVQVCHSEKLEELDLIEASFKRAVEEETAALGPLGRKEMQLHFYAKVPANYWIGKALSTPNFPVDGGLEQGLHAWRSLTLARAAVFRGRTNRYTILQHHPPDELESYRLLGATCARSI